MIIIGEVDTGDENTVELAIWTIAEGCNPVVGEPAAL